MTTLVEKCVNPGTNRPYPPGMIESALRDVHFSIDPKRSVKQQALEALPSTGNFPDQTPDAVHRRRAERQRGRFDDVRARE